jgi:hypothetical protein
MTKQVECAQNGWGEAFLTKTRTAGILARRIAATFALLLGTLSPAFGQRWHASASDNQAAERTPPLDDMAHMSWTRRDVAPSDITALVQTADGYLWVGSRIGLDRFDGLKFSSYPFTAADPRLSSSDIAALAADPDGGLWIGYRMGGNDPDLPLSAAAAVLVGEVHGRR